MHLHSAIIDKGVKVANFKSDLIKETLAKTQKLTKQVNQRLLRLEREIGKGVESQEIKNLQISYRQKSLSVI